MKHDRNEKRFTLNLNPALWYWCSIPGHEIDALHGWPHAAICEVENDGSGFAVQGKDIKKSACTIIEYTAKKDGITREIVIDGWGHKGQPATRLRMFGQDVLCTIRTEYGTVQWDSLTPEQQACLTL